MIRIEILEFLESLATERGVGANADVATIAANIGRSEEDTLAGIAAMTNLIARSKVTQYWLTGPGHDALSTYRLLTA